jgi:hopanoid biosynthesis associated radical SAM protein HpnH
MRFSPSLYGALTGHFFRNVVRGEKRFPLVLMLEPTHRCNLACAGCDRIRLFGSGRSTDLSVEECVHAAMESKAPVVTVTGGEPLLYSGLDALLHELLRLNRHVYLCTNGILAASFVDRFPPHPRLTLNFHVDGTEETHDAITRRPGTFRQAVDGITRAKKNGFRVWTNTSVYRGTRISDLLELFSLLTDLGTDGLLVSPAFSYESVGDDIFLSREQIVDTFARLDGNLDRFPLMSTPLYLDFLKGKEQMECTPWGNPTRNPLGWKSPCYLITDRYYSSFSELMKKTRWEKYGPGRDRRCAHCMVHSGFEPTVMRECFAHPRKMLKMLWWNLKPVRSEKLEVKS